VCCCSLWYQASQSSCIYVSPRLGTTDPPLTSSQYRMGYHLGIDAPKLIKSSAMQPTVIFPRRSNGESLQVWLVVNAYLTIDGSFKPPAPDETRYEIGAARPSFRRVDGACT